MMPEIPALPAEPGHYSLSEIYRVTEWRGGAVYRTEFVGLGWRDIVVPQPLPADTFWNSLRTAWAKECHGKKIYTMRSVRTK